MFFTRSLEKGHGYLVLFVVSVPEAQVFVELSIGLRCCDGAEFFNHCFRFFTPALVGKSDGSVVAVVRLFLTTSIKMDERTIERVA